MADIVIAPLVLMIGFCLYFIPSFIAFRRNHQNRIAILLLNIFLGFTGLGWVGALIWAVTSGFEISPSKDTLSIADEITKYHSLFSDGIISEDEFNNKKKELLRK